MRGSPTAHPGLVLLLTAALFSVALLVAKTVGGDESDRMPSWPVGIGFFVALTVAGMLNLEYFLRGEVDAIDHFETALAPALFFLPVPLVIALAAAGKATSQIFRGVAPIKASFNVAQWSAATALGGLTFAALRTRGPVGPIDLGPLAVAMVVVALANASAVLMVLTLAHTAGDRGWFRRTATSLVHESSVNFVVNVSFGLLFVTTYAWAPSAWPILLVPLALLHWASRGYAVGRIEQARLQVAQRATSALSASAMPDNGFSAFCCEVGLGLERDAVDLLLVKGPQLYTWRRSDSAQPNIAEPTALLDALGGSTDAVHIDAALSSGPPVEALRSMGWRDCTCAPIRVADETAGVLCVYDARRAVAFPDRELQSVAAMAREVGLAVEKAGLVASIVSERQNLAQIVNEAQDGIATLGNDGLLAAWNPALERLTGYASEQVIGTPGLDMLAPVDSMEVPVTLSNWVRAVDDPPTELLVRTRSGEKRWLSCSYAKAQYQHGQADHLIIMARDVSELKQAEKLISGHATVLELIAESAPLAKSLEVLASSLAELREGARCALLLLDVNENRQPRLVASSGVDVATLRAINAFGLDPHTSITGAAIREQRVVSVEDIRDDDAWPRWPEPVLGTEASGCWAVPIQATQTDRVLGVMVVFAPSSAAVRHGSNWTEILQQAARIAAIAVTRSQFETQLAHQATHDELTGLPNRAVFLDRCDIALRRRRRSGADVVVLFIDLDRFKLVNDSRGHEVGDQLLVAVSQRLQEVIRETDTVARFGGDEFAVLCEGVADYPRVLELADRVQQALAVPIFLAGSDLFVPASIGVAILRGGMDVATLVGNADAAMYRAKQLGGNRCEIFEQATRTPASLRLSIYADMHRALERDEFFVNYQPLVSLNTGAVTGVEALLRWRHPERGLLVPHDFLSFAESSGLILPIGERVLNLACRQARRWQSDALGNGLRVNINLSPLQFLQPNLAETLTRALDTSGVAPGLVGLEITESAIMEDTDATVNALEECRQLGVALIIDDFGTGYSSLTHLKRFPVDELKVDQSFVAGLCSSDKDGVIVKAVIALAHSLGLSAVAEGVESAEQQNRLKELDCDIGQGYYFGRPGAARHVLPLAH